MSNHTVYIDRGDINIAVEVDLIMTYKGCPAHMGDLNYPGHPAEPPEFDIKAMVALGYDLTEAEKEKAYDLAVEEELEDMWNENLAD